MPETPNTDDEREATQPGSPLLRDDADIDDDRQDPPAEQRAEELDGTTATPGDQPEDDED